MTGRDRFSGDEWSLLGRAPLLAAMMVLSAGRGGRVRGTLAIVGEYAAARDRASEPFVAELFAGPAPRVRARRRDRDALAREAPAALRAAVELLADKASPAERDDYARFALAVSAAAAGSGGGTAREAAHDEIVVILAAAGAAA